MVSGDKSALAGFDLLADLGDGMKLYMADLASLREQDVNARIMPPDLYNNLSSNIKKRGKLESVPYCALVDGRVEIVSGHNRVKAARSIGMQKAPILVDESGLSRPEIVAKQLAHNSLAGFDDPQTLQILFAKLDEPSLIFESGLSQEMVEVPQVNLDTDLTPSLSMDWRVVTFTFLDHQLKEFKTLIDTLPSSDLLGVADLKQHQAFTEATSKYGRFQEIRSLGLIIAALTETALAEVAKAEAEMAAEEAEAT